MISPLAYVDPEAKLGKNVTVLPFAYIERCFVPDRIEVVSENRLQKPVTCPD